MMETGSGRIEHPVLTIETVSENADVGTTQHSVHVTPELER
jgi:hypothetical protein